MFQFPGFAFVTLCIQVQIPSSDICKSQTDAPFRIRHKRHPHVLQILPCRLKVSPFGVTDIEGGFPHSEIPGSKLVRSSPGLIAAYHVLHRLLAPRHPPNALLSLDHSHYRCSPRSARDNIDDVKTSFFEIHPDYIAVKPCKSGDVP